MYQSTYWTISICIRFPKFFSIHELKLIYIYISLSQKDTMDRGAWIKIQKERHAGGLIWNDKSSKARKVLKWHGNEEQMNIYVHHMSRSCGVQAGSYLKTEVTNETHFSASTELSGLENLGFHSPKLDCHQWLKVHTSAIWEIQIAGRIQQVRLLLNSLSLKD